MDYNERTMLRRFADAERERAIEQTYAMRQTDGFATARARRATSRGLAAAVRRTGRALERLARALEQATPPIEDRGLHTNERMSP